MGQLLKVPSARQLNCFFSFDECRYQRSAYIWVVLQLSEYNMHMVQAAPHLTGSYREHSEMHKQFCIPQM